MRVPFLLTCLGTIASMADQQPITEEYLNDFYNEYVNEEVATVQQVYGQAPTVDGTVTPPPPAPPGPPAPPTNPLNPVPLRKYLPVVISNTTGLEASQVYVLLAGQQTVADPKQYFFQLGKNGVMTPVSAGNGTFSVYYSYRLDQLPRSSTGDNDYLIYTPGLNGARFYFSINKPMYLQSDWLSPTTNQIVAPTYFAFYDPNYSNLYESVEITFFPTGGGTPPAIPWTASVNTTEVDAFGLPVKIGYYSYSPTSPSALTPLIQNPNALPSGFGVGGLADNTTRSEILTTVVAGLSSGDQSGEDVWERLAIPFYENPYDAGSDLVTYLRVLSPKQSLGNAANPTEVGGLTTQHIASVDDSGIPPFKNYNYPPFPADYLSATTYGDASGFATSLFTYYQTNDFYLSTGGGSPTVYLATSDGSTLTFTGQTGPNSGQVSTLARSDLNTFKMYSGSQLMTGGPDADDLGFYFGDAFTVGFLASLKGSSSDTTQANGPINITDAVTWEPLNIADYYDPQYELDGGPWLSLYAKLLHSVAVRNTVTVSPTLLNGYGLCYAYDFDDSLGISGTITPRISTLNSSAPFLVITLGEIDTDIPNPYSDTTEYDVTFEYPGGGRSLEYKQGNGAWTPVDSGAVVSGLQSNTTTPLKIRYVNNQGPYTYHEFDVYLKYQILQPVNTYNSSELNIINSTTIVPNSATPTGFTINLLP